MGILLDFASAPRPTTRTETRRSTENASQSASLGEVIPFPGVRYERMALDLSARIGTIGKLAGPAVSDQE